MESKLHAVFVLLPLPGGRFAATTRKDGGIGLPGGKVDPGEDPITALRREAEEEGWKVSIPSGSAPIHVQDVDGKPVAWYLARSGYRVRPRPEDEARGIGPVDVSPAELIESGMGNAAALAAAERRRRQEAIETYRKEVEERREQYRRYDALFNRSRPLDPFRELRAALIRDTKGRGDKWWKSAVHDAIKALGTQGGYVVEVDGKVYVLDRGEDDRRPVTELIWERAGLTQRREERIRAGGGLAAEFGRRAGAFRGKRYISEEEIRDALSGLRFRPATDVEVLSAVHGLNQRDAEKLLTTGGL